MPFHRAEWAINSLAAYILSSPSVLKRSLTFVGRALKYRNALSSCLEDLNNWRNRQVVHKFGVLLLVSLNYWHSSYWEVNNVCADRFTGCCSPERIAVSLSRNTPQTVFFALLQNIEWNWYCSMLLFSYSVLPNLKESCVLLFTLLFQEFSGTPTPQNDPRAYCRTAVFRIQRYSSIHIRECCTCGILWYNAIEMGNTYNCTTTYIYRVQY